MMKLSVNVVAALCTAGGLGLMAAVCGTTTEVRHTTPAPQSTPAAAPAPAPVKAWHELVVPEQSRMHLVEKWECPACGMG